MRYENTNGIVQKFVYDPTSGRGAEASDPEIDYNPAKVSGPSIVPGDQHDNNTLTVAIAHEFGHTEVGRAVLGLPAIPRDVDPTDPEMIIANGPNRVLEETRAVYFFENPVRAALGLPLRTSYYNEGDVLRHWGPTK